jgi:hypothetical protein
MGGQVIPASRQTVASYQSHYHRDCGGFIKHISWDQYRTCTKCAVRWRDTTFERFTDQDLADRFYLEPPRGVEKVEVLVWKADPVTGRRYTALVPPAEAGGHDRFQGREPRKKAQ